MSEVISTYEGMKHISVPCHNCGDPVRTLIELGSRAPRRVCERCRHVNRASCQIADQQGSELAMLARYALKHWGQNSPVKVFKPGDPGFSRRAAQVSFSTSSPSSITG